MIDEKYTLEIPAKYAEIKRDAFTKCHLRSIEQISKLAGELYLQT